MIRCVDRFELLFGRVFFGRFFPGLLQGGCWKRTVDDRLVDVLMSWNHMITNGNVTLDSVPKSGI